MQIRNWKQLEEYEYTVGLNSAQWAWEFLRRNPDYQNEWQSFMQVWHALEEKYGKPPNRDFCAWKLDSRAWVHANDCPAGECCIDEDKVLIECAIGARWGFHKFPPDPMDDNPVGGHRLSWRAVKNQNVPLILNDSEAFLGSDPAKVAIGFDLSLPLKQQIENSKRYLQMLQRQRLRSGEIVARSVSNLRPVWKRYLKLLDAVEAGAGEEELVRIFGDEWIVDLQAAQDMVAVGYLEIPRMPE